MIYPMNILTSRHKFYSCGLHLGLNKIHQVKVGGRHDSLSKRTCAACRASGPSNCKYYGSMKEYGPVGLIHRTI